MHRPAPDIYSGELVEITERIVADLKAVARTRHEVAMYIGNGHAAWEAALSNVTRTGWRPRCGRTMSGGSKRFWRCRLTLQLRF